MRDGETGFCFEEASTTALGGALERMLEAFADPTVWDAMREAAMAEDFSWTASAERYSDLYAEVRRRG